MGWVAGGCVATVTAAATVAGCAGPVALQEAMRRDDQRTYLTALADHRGSGREAFFAGKAKATNRSIEEVVAADERMSETRNPFDAYRDPSAVCRGAVIYYAHCMSCHGEDARGRGPAMPADLPKMDFHSFGKRLASTLHRGAPRSWFRKIHGGYTSKVTGSGGEEYTMPACLELLAKEQIWLAITYLQSLDIHAERADPREGGESARGGLGIG